MNEDKFKVCVMVIAYLDKQISYMDRLLESILTTNVPYSMREVDIEIDELIRNNIAIERHCIEEKPGGLYEGMVNQLKVHINSQKKEIRKVGDDLITIMEEEKK